VLAAARKVGLKAAILYRKRNSSPCRPGDENHPGASTAANVRRSIGRPKRRVATATVAERAVGVARAGKPCSGFRSVDASMSNVRPRNVAG